MTQATPAFDAVVIGAGFSGLYMLHRLRDLQGLSVKVFERASGVGGTWYWNRYPGARCDTEGYIYCYSFDKELRQEWNWSGKYPLQPEILAYLNHFADRYDLRRDIQFETSVTAAHFNDDTNLWEIETDRGDTITARYFITAIGCLSTSQVPNIKGRESFRGEQYHTGSWPHEGVDFRGKRVGVIGTGSSGMQSIPVIAQEAGHLYVFQRTPQYAVPAHHGTVDRAFLDEVKRNYDAIFEEVKYSEGGSVGRPIPRSALRATPEEREAVYEKAWAAGGFRFIYESFEDIATDRRANDTVSEFIRAKIRSRVHDPEVAEKLMPVDHPFTSKRMLVDTDYYETYNRPNVTLVDIRHAPIEEITPDGIRTEDGDYDLDVIVYATGFDAMTGSYLKMDIRGRDGVSLRDAWADGPHTYLGLQVPGFPNMFTITGPGSPSVLSNMPICIEQHVEFISDLIEHLRTSGRGIAEADPAYQAAWDEHVAEAAEKTLYVLADSWYLGANIPGKPRTFMPYAGGVGTYRRKCEDVAAKGYEGFVLRA